MSTPTKFHGRLIRLDIGMGGWALAQDSGTQLTLIGSVPANLEGCQVEVQGTKKSSFGFLMSGPTVNVSAIRALRK